jgi:hypothetical protein
MLWNRQEETIILAMLNEHTKRHHWNQDNSMTIASFKPFFRAQAITKVSNFNIFKIVQEALPTTQIASENICIKYLSALHMQIRQHNTL